MNSALSEITAENRVEIENYVADEKARTGLSYIECRNRIRDSQPHLFGLSREPIATNRITNSLRHVEDDAARAERIAEAISEYRNLHPQATYVAARDAVRASNPSLFS